MKTCFFFINGLKTMATKYFEIIKLISKIEKVEEETVNNIMNTFFDLFLSSLKSDGKFKIPKFCFFTLKNFQNLTTFKLKSLRN